MSTRDTGTQHKLRMPPELKEKLFESAKVMNRSLNSEIVARLEQSFETENTSIPNQNNYHQLIAETMNQLIKSLVKSGVDPKTLVDAMNDLANE